MGCIKKHLRKLSEPGVMAATEPKRRVKPSLLSRVTFSYMDPLLRLGAERPLKPDDLPPVWHTYDAETQFGDFQKAWKEEEARVEKLPEDKATGLPVPPSLLRVLWAQFGTQILGVASCFKAGVIAMAFCIPIVFNQLITHLEKKDHWEGAAKNYGYFYALLLFGLALTKALVDAQYFNVVQTAGVQLRGLLICVVYRKSLRLAPAARQRRSTGETVNIMQVDAMALENMIQQVNYLWGGMVEIAGYSAQLIWFLGPAGLAGIAMMIALVPMQKFIMVRTMMLRKQSQQTADRRVKQVTEVLQGIRAVKISSWERAVAEAVRKMRAAELADLRLIRLLRAASTVLFTCAPLLVAMSTIAAFSWLQGRTLTPARIFTALMLVNSLRMPLAFYPMVLNMTAMAFVSLRRIHFFLVEEEVVQKPALPAVTEEGATEPAVKITEAAFSWEGDAVRQAAYDKEKAAMAARLAKMRQGGPGGGGRGGGRGGGGGGGRGGGRGYRAAAEKAAAEKAAAEKAVETETKAVELELKVVSADAAEAKEAAFALGSKEAPVALSVMPGQLLGVVGPVGCGKSSLCAALLGEMNTLQGDVEVRGSIAYVPQAAFILNATLQENVLFGLPFDEEKFNAAIRLSELQRDVEILPNGWDTEIGEKGVNLSGGQKQRVSLARAVYADADVYILDDPLSALDTQVGRSVFHNCILTALAGKTRVLVTNQLQLLRHCDRVLMLAKGGVRHFGSFEDLTRRQSSELSNTLKDYGGVASESDGASGDGHANALVAVKQAPLKTDEKLGKLTTAETKHEGQVERAVLIKYLRATNSMGLGAFVIILYIATIAVLLSADWWLSFWMSETRSDKGQGLLFYLGIYSLISLAAIIVTYMRQLGLLHMSVKASKSLHDELFESVLQCPLSFFDTTPVGRITARFSRDVDTIDQTLADSISQFFQTSFTVLGSIAMVVTFLPWLGVLMLPLLFLYYRIMYYYRASSRELKRIEALARSPVYATFSETLLGLDSVRAYHQQPRLQATVANLVDQNFQAYYPLKSLERWIGLRLETIGALVVFAAGCLSVWSAQSMYVGLAALVLYRASSLTGILAFTVRAAVECENQLTAVERLWEYISQLPSEAPHALPADDKLPATVWPSSGEVSLHKVVMAYREGLEPALRGISATIKGGEKVGVVGRTGAGKSSMLAVLLRLQELQSGTVCIDGEDIKQMGLATLRSRVGSVPQDPVMFSGTVRFNLDPFNLHADHVLVEALQSCDLQGVFELEAEVAESGGNFSAGQRQLLCLARCLVTKPRILLLDEATSSVDYKTDQLIQSTIRDGFRASTVITIAHRLHTIADSDRIMCLDFGKLVNFDTPTALLADPTSIYAQLVSKGGTLEAPGTAAPASAADQ